MRAGTVVAERFEIDRLAGAGGMGRVYRARDRQGGARVAVKVLSQAGLADDARFAREVEALTRLRHPHIVGYVAHGRVPGGAPFVVMEWVEGQSLADRLADGPLSLPDALDLAIGVADALALAHAQGIVHRDVKPSNVQLVDGDPRRPKLLDFGTARLTEGAKSLTLSGMIIGTPGFMSPEQARGAGRIDARADVFALGCVLYECLTGQPAFSGATVMAVLAKVVLEEAPRLAEARTDAPEALDELLARMLAKEPDARPASGAALLAELRPMRQPAPATAPIPVVTPRARPRGVGSGE
jgi:serine/threonine protein kinase